MAGVFSLICVLLAVQCAGAHEAESGWRYPYACCSDRDCREVTDAAVSEGPQGYMIKVTGEILPYTDKRVRNSPDGVFHWCSVAGKNDTRTICLFVPPRSF
ncbi:hypothetical protein [uncultured Nitratireductor sp.]|uniref:hypothetical protein n=1 Tax=uncultured Nitratireductor sp. TaxID=520953 RepID=UPI0025FDF36B|nr:hypothetical protein [uncultured Nitratireductor sp.]